MTWNSHLLSKLYEVPRFFFVFNGKMAVKMNCKADFNRAFS